MTQRLPDAATDSFVHLQVHSEFSLLDGLSRIPEMTKRVAEQGMPALALTDHGSMYGVIPFYAAAKKAGIKPIIGVEAYVAPPGMTDKEGKADADYHHMILLAKTDVGYKNLLALTTAAHLDGYFYKPRIDKELLASIGHSVRWVRMKLMARSMISRDLSSSSRMSKACRPSGWVSRVIGAPSSARPIEPGPSR